MIIFGFTFSTTDLWLLGVCGALLLALVRFRFISTMRNRDIFNVSAKEFTDTFHRELKEIYPTPTSWPDDIDYYLRTRFDNLDEAVGKFKGYISWRKQKSFDKDWFRFYCCTGREVDKNCQVYHHYMPFKGVSSNGKKIIEHDNTKTFTKNFKDNVEKLLSYAKQK